MACSPRSIELDSLIDLHIGIVEDRLRPMLTMVKESRMPVLNPDPVTEGLKELNKLWFLRRLTDQSEEKDQIINDLIIDYAYQAYDDELWNSFIKVIK
jgi:hypothetical protein